GWHRRSHAASTTRELSGVPCSRRHGRSRRFSLRRRRDGEAGRWQAARKRTALRSASGSASLGKALMLRASLNHSDQRTGFTTLWNWLAGTSVSSVVLPSGQRICTFSAFVALPRPKCSLGSPWDRYPRTGTRSSICTSDPAVTVTRAPIASILPPGSRAATVNQWFCVLPPSLRSNRGESLRLTTRRSRSPSLSKSPQVAPRPTNFCAKYGPDRLATFTKWHLPSLWAITAPSPYSWWASPLAMNRSG